MEKPGSNPVFLERGFKLTKGGSSFLFCIYNIFENPHENEIICRGRSRISDEGVQMAKGEFVLVLLPKFS